MKIAVPIVILLLIVAVWLVARSRSRNHSASVRVNEGKAADIYLGLRNQALTRSRSIHLADGQSSAGPYAVLMDWGMDNGTATILASIDGTASIYLSSGGGNIGGGVREPLHTLAKQAVELAGTLQPQMRQTTEYPLPVQGKVIFYVVMDAGVFTATASQADLAAHRDPMWRLGDAMQNIITEYRDDAEK